jgi:hypothetical protein
MNGYRKPAENRHRSSGRAPDDSAARVGYRLTERQTAACDRAIGQRSAAGNGAQSARPVPLGLALACLAPELRRTAERCGAEGWAGLTQTMRERCALLAIDQESWAKACAVLGRADAALCVIVVEHGTTRSGERAVRSPGAYFRAMIERGREGRLHLDRSLLAIARQGPERSGGGAAPGARGPEASRPTAAPLRGPWPADLQRHGFAPHHEPARP